MFTDAGFRERNAAPPTERERLFWFGSVPVLDVWPVWIVLWGGPKWLYLLAAFLLCAATGFVVLARAVRSRGPEPGPGWTDRTCVRYRSRPRRSRGRQ